MNIAQETKKKGSLSNDLTVVFLRGNGNPRSFRVKVPALQRSLLGLSVVVTGLFFALLFFLGLYLIAQVSEVRPLLTRPAPVAVAPSNPNTTPTTSGSAPTESTPSDPAQKTGGLWDKISGSFSNTTPNVAGKPATDFSEQEQEIIGLRNDISALNAKIDGRKNMQSDVDSNTLMRFFSPSSTLIPEIDSVLKVKNAKIGKDNAAKELYLNFEIHNTDPTQKQIRGYILVLAKTNDLLAAYPANAFSPNQNILLNFTNGETFAVSRFREAHASFESRLFEGKKVSFQILLFDTQGKILSNQHVEDK